MYRLIIVFLFFYPALLQPIDVVYTWVDGSDTQWQESKEACAKKDPSLNPMVFAKRRFKNHDELKYSLRSILDFAPWITHIYIVTCGQRPKWLKDHPMITVIDHKEIFKNPDNLPTFNSMAIECNLHHIPNLSEYYLYFNDDVFLGRPSNKETFFTIDGKSKIFTSTRKIPTSLPSCGEEGFLAASKNFCALLQHIFGKSPKFMHSHTPYPSKKSLIESFEKRFSTIFEHVSSHRFRSIDDFAITNGIIPYTALYMNEAVEEEVFCETISVGKHPESDGGKLQLTLQTQPLFYCIQDASDDESEELNKLLKDFFIKYYPHPAPWEEKDPEETDQETPPSDCTKNDSSYIVTDQPPVEG
jgi:hypothetical protein